MPLVTTLIDDKSPLILYDASWAPGTSADSLADEYYLGTFTTNNVTDGKATFTFNGTAFWIYGAKRSNHGSYTVQVDQANYANNNGQSNDALFQQSLFNMSGLSQGAHTVSLTNTASGNLYVDIDLIVWQSEVGNDGDQLVTETVEDTDPRFQYQEPGWSATSSNLNFNFFSNGSGHSTSTYNASVTFAFTGEAVTLYGATGPNNGPYTVQLDGGQVLAYNATAFLANYAVALYHADNLGPGQHEMVVTNLPDANGQSLTIDYAMLSTLLSSSSTSGSGPGTSISDASTSSNHLSSGAIAGIAVAVAAAVVAAATAFFFYRRWKAAEAAQNELYRVHTPQRHPHPDTTTATTTAISSSLATRSNASLLRNDASSSAPSGRSYHQADYDYQAAQYGGHARAISGSQESRMATVNENAESARSPTQSSMDESMGRRPLPEAPGGGLPLTTELSSSKLASRQSLVTNRTSLPPPNYTQATEAA